MARVSHRRVSNSAGYCQRPAIGSTRFDRPQGGPKREETKAQPRP